MASEIAAGTLDDAAAMRLLDAMLAIRELEDMIVRLRSGGYEPLPGYDYRGPTHVSIGQEAVAIGAAFGMRPDDRITSSHRGHGDAIAKGFAAIHAMDDEALRARTGSAATDHEALLEAALEEHVYRTIAELFGKEEGYCRGRGGGMHIADFSPGTWAPTRSWAAAADRHGCRHGAALRAPTGGVLLGRRWRDPTASSRVAQLGGQDQWRTSRATSLASRRST